MLTCLVLWSLAAAAQTGPAPGQVGTVTVRVAGFKHSKGAAMIALTTEKGFLASSGAIRTRSVPIRDGQVTVMFDEVPYGRYACRPTMTRTATGDWIGTFSACQPSPTGFRTTRDDRSHRPRTRRLSVRSHRRR